MNETNETGHELRSDELHDKDEGKKSSTGNRLVSCLALFGGLVLLSLALVGAMTLGRTVLSQTMATPTSSPTCTPTPVPILRPAVIERIRAVSELVTVRYTVQKVVEGFRENQAWTSRVETLFGVSGQRVLLVAYGEVVAGLDLSRIGEDDIIIDGDQVVIILPVAEILSGKLDNEKTYVYDYEKGIFTPDDPGLFDEVRQMAEKEIVEAALEDGILDKAQTNAQAYLLLLLHSLGFREVKFMIATPTPTSTPTSTATPTVEKTPMP